MTTPTNTIYDLAQIMRRAWAIARESAEFDRGQWLMTNSRTLSICDRPGNEWIVKPIFSAKPLRAYFAEALRWEWAQAKAAAAELVFAAAIAVAPADVAAAYYAATERAYFAGFAHESPDAYLAVQRAAEAEANALRGQIVASFAGVL